jgi:alkylated DNA repair dioxygenase AlkB
MDLFDELIDPSENLLPEDGQVYYHGRVFSYAQADMALAELLHNVAWANDEALIYGKLITTRRKVAWYGDQPFQYTYSKVTKQALPWTQPLLALKTQVEQSTGESFNSCLLNLYHDGSEGMAWHSDGEIDLKKNGAIASVSFGAQRKFCFKHKQTKQVVQLVLQHGSILVMTGTTQSHWLHRLPPSQKITQPRVNLTFRTIQY